MLKTPTKYTLRKYGLSKAQWQDMANQQNGLCAICKKLPKSNRLCIDHYHARGFKNMAAEDKRKCVRGLLCSYCNRYLVCKNTFKTIDKVKEYLNSGVV